MTSVVIDSSATLGLTLLDESSTTAEAAAVAMRNGAQVFAPAHWCIEVANGILMAERRKRLTPADAGAALNYVRRLPVTIDDETINHAFAEISALARLHGLTAYDAAYLELAIRRRAALATLDGDLRRVAVSIGVPLISPED